jgi:hypothetical protein
LRRLGAVVVIIAGLTAGWPLVNTLVSSRQPVAANTTFVIGPRRSQSARFTVGPGWSMLRSQSDPRRGYSLSWGPMHMSVFYVAPVLPADAVELWPGLLTILQISHPGARLGAPGLITSFYGDKGLAGEVTGRGFAGHAVIFANLARRFAIEMVMLAPKSASARQIAAAERVVRSVKFPSA